MQDFEGNSENLIDRVHNGVLGPEHPGLELMGERERRPRHDGKHVSTTLFRYSTTNMKPLLWTLTVYHPRIIHRQSRSDGVTVSKSVGYNPWCPVVRSVVRTRQGRRTKPTSHTWEETVESGHYTPLRVRGSPLPSSGAQRDRVSGPARHTYPRSVDPEPLTILDGEWNRTPLGPNSPWCGDPGQ